MSQNSLGLAETITKVKQELLEHVDQRGASSELFFVDHVEIELAVKITKEGRAGVNIQVLEIAGDVGSENAQTVKITLSPLMSKEAMLQQMTPEELLSTLSDSRKAIARGGKEVIGPDDV